MKLDRLLYIEPDDDGLTIIFSSSEDGPSDINLTWDEAWKLLLALIKAFGVKLRLQ